MPDRRAGEAVDDLHTQLLGGSSGVLHFLDRPGTFLLRVAPDLGRDPVVGALVEDVENELADEVVGNRPALQSIAAEQVVAFLAVILILEGFLDVEVIAPAGELDPVVAPFACLLADDLEGEVGPLAREQRDGSRHLPTPAFVGELFQEMGDGDLATIGVSPRKVNDLTTRSAPAIIAEVPAHTPGLTLERATPLKPPRALLFDFDGVIADTENHHIVAWQRTFGLIGMEVDDAVCARAAEVDDREFLTDFFTSRKIVGGDVDGWIARKQTDHADDAR